MATSSTTAVIPEATSAPLLAPVAGNDQPRTGPTWVDRPASDLPAPPLPADWVVEPIGTSFEGRSIDALRRPADPPGRTVVVVGGIHGNEPVSPPIVRSLVEVAVPGDMEVWLVPELNPDGVARGSRANARAVDLNRNFAWRWDAHDGGPGPLSEPETSAIARLVESLQPDLVVWVHQPLGYVSSIGGTPDAYEQAWSRGSGEPVRPDVTQHGGGESWTAFVAGVPSMLIEADTYDATSGMVAAHQNGFRELIAALG